MKWKWLIVCGAVVLSVGAWGSSPAQEKGKTPAQEEIEKAMMKAAQPGEHHKHLEAWIGSWTFDSKMWMAPGAPPTESKGTCERKMIFGGRYLYEEFKGEAGGMPFEGLGITGYDNVAGMYRTFWIDNMGTTMMTGTGQCGNDGKVLEMKLQYTDPMTGGEQTARTVSTMESADKQTFEYYGKGPDGKEFKMMEIVYERR